MRSLQTKQPPAVRFTYQGSPSQQQSLHYRPQSFSNSFSPPPQPFPNPNPPTLFRTTNFGGQSHIKIVEMSQSQQRRERRRKIFEEVGELARQSKSRQRNRSYSIFNGTAQDSNKVKELILSKESCKEQSVQTEVDPPKQQKISTFMQSSQKTPPQTFQQPAVIDISRDQPLEYSKYVPVYASAPDPLEKQLSLKEKELTYLKLQLERHERCEKITHENESIYKRLVQKLDTINQSTVATLQRHPPSQRHSPSKKSKSKSPQRNRQEQSPSDTTRFIRPSSARKQASAKKEVLVNVLNQMVTADPPTPRNELSKSNEVTFNKHEHKRGKARRNTQIHLHLQQPMTTDEELRERLEESVRRYTNTVSFQEVPINHKLASINRHLQNKYYLQQASQFSYSRLSSLPRRGRSITSTHYRLHL